MVLRETPQPGWPTGTDRPQLKGERVSGSAQSRWTERPCTVYHTVRT